MENSELKILHARWLLRSAPRWPMVLALIVAAASQPIFGVIAIGEHQARQELEREKSYSSQPTRVDLPDSENAAVLWSQANQMFEIPPAPEEKIPVNGWKGGGIPTPPPPRLNQQTDPFQLLKFNYLEMYASSSLIRRTLDCNTISIELMRKAAQRPHARIDWHTRKALVIDLRTLLNLFVARSAIAAHDNDWSTAVESVRVCVATSEQHCESQLDAFIPYLYAAAIDSQAARSIEYALQAPESFPPLSAVEDLLAIVDSHSKTFPPLLHIVVACQAWELEEFERDLVKSCGIQSLPLSPNISASTFFTARYTHSKLTEELIEIAKAADDGKRRTNHLEWIESSAPFRFSQPQMGVTYRPERGTLEQRAKWRTVYAALQVLKYRYTHKNQWPVSLEELNKSATWLIDPWDPTFSYLGYRVSTEDHALLWSVGADGQNSPERRSSENVLIELQPAGAPKGGQ